MCLQDIQIARATSAYSRQFTPTGSLAVALAANPRRYALILPSVSGSILGWSLVGNNSGSTTGTQFITGQALGSAAISEVLGQGIVLTLSQIGNAIQADLFCALLSGAAGSFNITEILFNIEIPPLKV